MANDGEEGNGCQLFKSSSLARNIVTLKIRKKCCCSVGFLQEIGLHRVVGAS